MTTATLKHSFLLWIQDFVRQGGNEVTERICIYWSPPGTDMRDGLCFVENDSHILAICEAVKEEKVVHLLVDHTNSIKRIGQDVVVPIPSKYLGVSVGDIEDAVEPSNVNGSDIEDAGDGNVPKGEENGEDGSDSADSEFYDSDWDIEDGMMTFSLTMWTRM
jgi:hypothetical protein